MPAIPRNLKLVLLLAGGLVAWFAVLRLGLIVRNSESAARLPWAEIFRSFTVGFRFDLAVACYLLLPAAVAGVLPKWGWDASPRFRRGFIVVFAIVVSFVTLILLAEYEFFHEFQTRLNQLAIQYWEQPATVAGMIWGNYPVATYLLVWLAASVLFAMGLARIFYWLYAREPSPRPHAFAEIAALFMIFTGLVLGMRGGIRGEPLRWGDAYQSRSEFINQMSLNGLYTLGVSFKDRFRQDDHSDPWMTVMETPKARQIVRAMLVEPDEQLIDSQDSTMLRIEKDVEPGWAALRPHHRPPNVVVVMMESFSARFVGAMGAPDNMTPEFNGLISDGILFDRHFSAGTHTHQGVFSSLLGFPNLPGFEYLMQNMVSNQEFTTLPAVLKQKGYQTLFLYNGNFAWDNMRGFFHKQGIDRFIGADDYINPTFKDDVWGVSDRDVFDRANQEFAEAAKSGPFFGAILTLSNHAPFDLPEPLPFERTSNMDDLNKRCDAIRYADWAVGRFIEQAKQMDYFDNTLFVFVGDHGFHIAPVLSEIHLLYHHVPLLFYAPNLLDQKGVVSHEVSSQVNIAPSVLALLGGDQPQAYWGRNLFSQEFAETNFAVIKGSGGDRAVGMVRGDKLLVIGTDGQARLWRYDLGFPPSIRRRESQRDQAELAAMRQELMAYIQCSLTDLVQHHAGDTRAASGPQ